MAVHIPGLIAMIVFYLIILSVGLWAGRKTRKRGTSVESMMIAGRKLGLLLGSITLTATWIGGGAINGTAEVVVRYGLVWCQAPVGYALSMFIGGYFFVDKMRSQGYVTMLDPFSRKYGDKMGGLLFIPAVFGEIVWSGAILAALGASLSVILELDSTISIIVSACIAAIYTFFGGLYSVAYTDIIQLFFIFVGLWLVIPFAFTHDAVGDITTNATANWIQTLDPGYLGVFIDNYMLLTLGGFPWHTYFQRVLACSTVRNAQIASYISGLGMLVLTTPSVLMGAMATVTDWNQTKYSGEVPIPKKDLNLIVPLVLEYLTPTVVAFIGLGAVSAAVMSSADSTILSASTMFTRNVYKIIFRPKASDSELMWVMRLSILFVGVLAAVIGIVVESIYTLWFLCSDLVYVLVCPQLLCVIYLHWTNTYGSLVGYILGAFFRLAGGEIALGMPALIKYPFYNDTDGQLFPFKTLSMLISLTSIICVSCVTKYLFEHDILHRKLDVFNCVVNTQGENIEIGETTNGTSTITEKQGKEGHANEALDISGDEFQQKSNTSKSDTPQTNFAKEKIM